jgi:hypothetical protein
VEVEGVKGIKYVPHAARNIEKSKKQVVSCTFWLVNHQKCCFFAQKYLSRYTPEMFFEEYVNLKIFIT